MKVKKKCLTVKIEKGLIIIHWKPHATNNNKKNSS